MKVKKIKRLFLVSLVIVSALSLAACGNTSGTGGNSPNQAEISTGKILKYKDSYVGDNSNVSSIITNLPAKEYYKDFELQTDNEPYEITINYSNFEQAEIKLEDGETSSEPFSEVIQKNSMVLFALVTNAEVVNFHLDDGSVYTYTRNELAAVYSVEFGDNFEKITESESSLEEFFKKDL